MNARIGCKIDVVSESRKCLVKQHNSKTSKSINIGVSLIVAKLFMAKSFVAESFVAKLDMASKSMAESIMAKVLLILSIVGCKKTETDRHIFDAS